MLLPTPKPSASNRRVLTDVPDWLWWLVFVSALLAIGPLWLTPEDISDGLFGSARVAMNDMAPVALLNREGNLHLFTVYYEWVRAMQNYLGVAPWIVYKAFNSVCIVLVGREVWLYARRVFAWSRGVAAYCLAMCWVFPVWSMLFPSVQMVTIFVVLVLMGHRLVHSANRSKQIMGWIALILSFHLNANFAFVFGLELMRWLLRDRDVKWSWPRSAGIAAISVATYGLSRLFFTPGGEFVGYNSLVDIRMFSAWGVLAVGFIKFATFLTIPLVVWAVFFVSMPWRIQPIEYRSLIRWLVLFLALGFTATFPYVAVGKSTALFFTAQPGTSSSFAAIRLAIGDTGLMSPWGIWSNRFALLLSVVCAWFAGLGLVWLSATCGRRLVAVGGGAAWLVSAALLAQAHGTKLDQLVQVPAIVAGLKSIPAPPGGMLDIEASPAKPFVFPEPHEPNWFAYRAWGERRWFSVIYYPDGASEKIVRDLAQRHYVMRANNRIRAGIYLADDYKGPVCQTLIKLVLPDVGRWDMLLLKAHRPGSITAASVQSVRTDCPPLVAPVRARSFSAM